MTGFAMAGVDVNKVYPAADFAPGDTAVVGSNRYQFVRAAGAIAAGDALIADDAHADEPFAWKPCTALDQHLMGISHLAVPSGSYAWVTVQGKVPAAKVAAATAAGASLGTSAAAGVLTTITAGADAGVSARAVDAESGGLAEVLVV